MVTKAADALMKWLLHEYPLLSYISISGNYCTDKKVCAVNGILGRGKLRGGGADHPARRSAPATSSTTPRRWPTST